MSSIFDTLSRSSNVRTRLKVRKADGREVKFTVEAVPDADTLAGYVALAESLDKRGLYAHVAIAKSQVNPMLERSFRGEMTGANLALELRETDPSLEPAKGNNGRKRTRRTPTADRVATPELNGHVNGTIN